MQECIHINFTGHIALHVSIMCGRSIILDHGSVAPKNTKIHKYNISNVHVRISLSQIKQI